MFQIRVNGAAMTHFRVACALAFALRFAPIASADSMEGAESASADSIEVAGIVPAGATEIAGIAPAPSVDSAEVAAVILSDDAMPQGPSVADRLAIIREKIQSALEYPPLARLHDSDGDALVRFEIDRSGSAENVRVVRSSGNDRLDTSAVRAVETASPLPWVYGPLEVPVHFELTASH
jgi:TonB family protein